jgi:hypothetical protein
MNGSTMELPALASELGLSSDHGAFRYSVASFDRINPVSDVTVDAAFNPWSPVVSTGGFADVPAGTSASIPLTYRMSAAAATKALGWMVVTLDDVSGPQQADLVSLPHGSASGRRPS